MPPQNFRALRVRRADDQQTATFEQITPADLPDGDVLVHISHSSLNYKDGLAVTGAGKVIRQFPMTPGIDLVGTVEESNAADFAKGDDVLLTGYGVGESHAGGYAEYARLQADWLVPLPADMTPEHAMAIGTAGFTAMLAVHTLEERGGLTPEAGEVVVTGASGGAGSMAVAILAQAGYQVVASTGSDETDYLRDLGATEIIGRFDPPERPLASGRWAGAVDGVGGHTLAHLLTTTAYGGSVAAYGLAGGQSLETTVIPFILRGVNLLGIDSVNCPMPLRQKIWQRLAAELSPDKIDQMMRIEPLSDVPTLSQQILAGDIRGRVVLDVSA